MINRILFSAIFFCCLQSSYPQPGKLDSTFGTNGIVTANLFDYEFYFADAAIQTDGKIVVAVAGDFALARYNNDGTLDSAFAQDGKQTTEFGSPFSDISEARSVAIQSDGKIVVGGYTRTGFAVARYNTNGAPDSSFSEDGKQITHFETFDYNTHGSSVAIQSDGKIVLAGTSLFPNDSVYFVLARYNIDGRPDLEFSHDGKQVTGLGVTTDFQSSAVAIQNDGKIIVLSSSSTTNPFDKYFMLVRYNTDGSLNNTFSDDGRETGPGVALSVAIQSDGKILVAGSALMRFNIDGSLDDSFSGDGKQPFGLGFINSIAIQKDGKIVAAGYVVNEDFTEDFAIARVNTNGSPDTTFGQEGQQVTTVTSRDRIYDIAISSNKLYAVGSGAHNYIGLIARYFLNDEDQTEAPAVALTSPAKNAIYTAPAAIKLNAIASDSDGTINKVEFYNGNTLLHTEHDVPYGFLWTNVQPDNYTLTAKATDNDGNVTTSDEVHVSVVPDKAPTVKIISPVDGANYTGNATIILSADANDQDGQVKAVSFYNGSKLIFTEQAPPFYRKWFNVKEGNYTITAKATDNNGVSTTSVPVHITVLASRSATVNIISPLNESKFTAPADVFLRADAVIPGGTISKVEFYNGNDLVLTEYKAPYGNKWRDVPPGNYSFTAKVTDGNGNVITSQPVQVTVTGPLARSIIREDKSGSSERALSLNVNPNPVANILSISVDGLSANSKSVISLISASGVVVKTLQWKELNKNMKLDVSWLSAGVYFIKVANGTNVLYKQFVKL